MQHTYLSASRITIKYTMPWDAYTRPYWYQMDKCPSGEKAVGFRTKVEGPNGDNTALNGVSLRCSGSTAAGEDEAGLVNPPAAAFGKLEGRVGRVFGRDAAGAWEFGRLEAWAERLVSGVTGAVEALAPVLRDAADAETFWDQSSRTWG